MRIRWEDVPRRDADVVVVGGGLAGMTAALEAVGRSVLLVTKTGFAAGGSSVYAQGGIAAAVGADDEPRLHAEDTLVAGAGLCDPEVVDRVTREGPERLEALMRLGARLDRDADGRLALGREGAHRRRRVAHAAGDATGAELVRALAEAVRRAPRVEIAERRLALELAVAGGRVCGLLVADADGRLELVTARDVVLATGGIGALYRMTTNPPEATGDGLAMAARAGARLAGLEMVQFHPTALAAGEDRLPLLTEALRGEGAVLVDDRGDRFMAAVHPLAELAPRDVVARAIWRRREDGREVFLDATSLGDRLEERFPTVVGLCRERGLDPMRQPVPVSPAAHYHMGGVVVDAEGRTSVPCLWACGEVAFTGLHGANRLASNSLLEAAVYGAAVGRALRTVRPTAVGMPPGATVVAPSPWLGADPSSTASAAAVRDLMWRHVGLARHAGGLRRALDELDGITAGGAGELASMLTVAQLVARAATARTESRGAHYRSDFPSPYACWRQDLAFEGERMVDPHPVAAPGAATG